MNSKMLVKARDLMNCGREDVAAKMLAWVAVELAIRTAAASGLASVILAPARPIKLKETTAGDAAVKRLRREGFRVEWSEHRGRPDEGTGDQLEIDWSL